jgi:hypothetical protein
MTTTPTNEYLVHRPGAVSAFFVYKAFFFAAVAWGAFVALAAREDRVTTWLVVAAASAVTFSLVGLALWIRHTGQLNSAARHEQIMKTLVDLSWQSFTSDLTGRNSTDQPTRDLARERFGPRDPASAHKAEGDTGVIHLEESRQRHRR